MNFEETIRKAATLAYEEDANQVVGKINGEWAIAHSEDMGRQADMTGETFDVTSSGLV